MSTLHPALVFTLIVACLPQPAAACGQRPLPVGCSVTQLAGEWLSADGHRLRIVDSRDRGFTLNAHGVDADGRTGPVLYRRLKPDGGCEYTGWRTAASGDLLPLRLSLDPVAGLLRDANDPATPRVYRRPPKTEDVTR